MKTVIRTVFMSPEQTFDLIFDTVNNNNRDDNDDYDDDVNGDD